MQPSTIALPAVPVAARSSRLDPKASVDFVGFVAVHVVALVGVLAVGCPLWAVALGVASYLVRCWGVVAGFHRYFSHRAFRLGRGSQLVVAILGTLAMQKGVLWWVSAHRTHHARSDQPGDPHSPRLRSLGYSHLGWLFDQANQPIDAVRVADWYRYPELRWLQRYRSVPVVLYGAGLWLAFGFPGFVWGFAVSSVALWHALLATGSIAHRLGGYRTFPTTDGSRNSRLLSALLLGDGWHNNHHRAAGSARLGIGWREPDPVWWSLRILEGVGLARGLRDTLPRQPRAGSTMDGLQSGVGQVGPGPISRVAG
jgi:stearoyl-CoA desaturase (delta-9 desaturase)